MSTTTHPTSRWPLPAALALLLVYALLALHHAWTTAPTFDELAHLPAGISYWEAGDTRLNREHPPLVKLVAGLPPWLLGTEVPLEGEAWQRGDEWTFGRQLLYESGNDPRMVLGAGRSACVGFGLLLGSVLFLWGRALVGPRAALLPLAMVCLSPLFVTHGSLVTTDVATAALLALCAWSAWRTLRGDGVSAPLATALGAAALTLTKYTAPVGLAGVGLAVLLATPWREARPRRRALTTLAALALPALLAALLLHGWPPDPTAYLGGIDRMGFNHQPGWTYWAFGGFAEGSRWWYFPAGLLVKSAPGTLLGLLLAGLLAALCAARRHALPGRPESQGWLLALVPAAVYAAVVIGFAPNVGVRYALPALALSLLVLAALPAMLATTTSSTTARWLPLLLVTSQAGGMAMAWPHPLPWFNGLLGCHNDSPEPCLDDSNLDWGQGLTALGSWAAEYAPGETVRVLVFTSVHHAAYADSTNMTSFELLRPYRALYAMSAQRMIRPPVSQEASPGTFWFQRVPADRVVAGVYHVWDLRDSADLEPLPEAPVRAETGNALGGPDLSESP